MKTAAKIVNTALPGDQLKKHPGAAQIIYDEAVKTAIETVNKQQA